MSVLPFLPGEGEQPTLNLSSAIASRTLLELREDRGRAEAPAPPPTCTEPAHL